MPPSSQLLGLGGSFANFVLLTLSSFHVQPSVVLLGGSFFLVVGASLWLLFRLR